MDKYILYLRKSQLDRDYEEVSVKETLSRHREFLTQFALERKLYVPVVLEEVVSGESLWARPRMLDALNLINTGEYAGIICMDTERLSRGSSLDSGYIMQTLQINKCKIITPSKTYDLSNESDEQFADMRFMFSRYELKSITKRLVRGRNISASEGKYLGSTAPYGYTIEKLVGKKGNTLKIIPGEAKIVRMIYDMYTEDGIGYETIQAKLNELHIPSRSGQWGKSSVVNILNNPVYTGKIRWRYSIQQKVMIDDKLSKKRNVNKDYETYEGLHEAIISDEQYDKACSIKDARFHPSTKLDRQLQNPFASLLYCSKCGRPIKRNLDQGRPSVTPWFRCQTSGCCATVKCHVLEDAIVKEMASWLDAYKLTIQPNSTPAPDNLQIAYDALLKQLSDLQTQQDKICDLLEKGIYSIDMFSKRNAVLSSDINRIQNDIADIKIKLEKQTDLSLKKNDFVPTVQKLLDSYSLLTPAEKNQLWLQVVEKITYYRTSAKEPFELHIYPKLPKL